MRIAGLSLYILNIFLSLAHGEMESGNVDHYWSEVFREANFNNTLAVFRDGPAEAWPAVYSAKHADSLPESNRVQQLVFQQLSARLAHDIELFEQIIHEQDATEFTKSIDVLLSIRRHIGQNPSYINLILVDTMNRVAFVNLAERLVSSKSLSPDLVASIEELSGYHPDMRQMRYLVEMETRNMLADAVEYDTVSDVDRLKALWAALEPDTTPAFPKNIHQIGTYQLLQIQDIPLLLNRLMMSDYYIRSALPDLVQYRQKAKGFSPDDTYQQIKAVLGEETKTADSLGAQFWGQHRAASTVNEVLQGVRSGKVRSQLYFSLPAKKGSAL